MKIPSMELLRNGRNFLVRVRTTDGAEGLAVPNAMHLVHHVPDLPQPRRAVLRRQGRARSSSRCSGSCTGTPTTTSTRGWPSGSAWRRPSSPSSTCWASCRASRSATCSAGSSGARSPSIAASGTRGNTPEEEIAVPQADRRRERREGPQVPPRRPDEQERRLAPRPHRAADPAGPRDVRPGHDPLRRFQQLVRRRARRSASAG